MNEVSIRIVIPLPPRTKKNHQRIVVNPKTKLPFVVPSKEYKEYEKNCAFYVKRDLPPIDYPIHVKYSFYMPTLRLCDKTNLTAAIDDILVKYGVLADDNYKIITSHDGTRVLYDKDFPRTEIEITPMPIEECWWITTQGGKRK